jgi:hypothetical protein
MTLNHRTLHTLGLYAILILSLASAGRLSAQNLTLEGQTGGFITPTAYSVYMEKGQTFSHPVVGYHFVGTAKVIGNIQTVSILEGFKNRGEIGYTRSIHTFGDSGSSTPLQLSQLWHYSGMNIFNGKVVLLNDNREGWKPGLAVGGVVRTGDKFVTGAVGQELAGLEGILQSAKASTNNDLYVAVSKTRLKAPVPFLLNAGWKVTNA